MSFITKIKQEAMERSLIIKNCYYAELNALITTMGDIDVDKKGIDVKLRIKYKKLHEKFQKKYSSIIKNVTQQGVIFLNKENNIDLLKKSGILIKKSNNLIINEGINIELIRNTCIKSFIRIIFIANATGDIQLSRKDEKKKYGYHIEFVFDSPIFAQDFSYILRDINIESHIAYRSLKYVVYIKDFENIISLLASIGASKSLFELENEGLLRNIRNKVNRENNCISANLSKTINASLEQLQAIDYIKKTKGLEWLPNQLEEIARLRLANPDESLDRLSILCDNKISKSGINHRLKKIVSIYKDLRSN